jgi:hypothetical protein
MLDEASDVLCRLGGAKLFLDELSDRRFAEVWSSRPNLCRCILPFGMLRFVKSGFRFSSHARAGTGSNTSNRGFFESKSPIILFDEASQSSGEARSKPKRKIRFSEKFRLFDPVKQLNRVVLVPRFLVEVPRGQFLKQPSLYRGIGRLLANQVSTKAIYLVLKIKAKPP